MYFAPYLTGFIVIAMVADSPKAEAVIQRRELIGRWFLDAARDKNPSSNDSVVFFQITADGAFSGFDGCNTFSGRLDAPEFIRKTQRDCIGNEITLPLDLKDPVAHLRSAVVEADLLRLPLNEGSRGALFRRQPIR